MLTSAQKCPPNNEPDVIQRESPSAQERIHYLDNLRALAMLLGVFLHGALAYAAPSQALWLATDMNASVTVDAAIWFIHLFRMALFFFLAGYFAKLVFVRKGSGRFVKSRLLRIALPFLLFYPLLLGLMTFVIVFALAYVKEPQGLLGLIAKAAAGDAGNETTALTTMHLWFLYYLLFFVLLTVVFARVPFPQFLTLDRHPWLILIAPLLLMPGIIAAGIPLPAPESFMPNWWPFAFYGLFYWAGWKLYGKEQWLLNLQPYTWHITIGCCLGFIPYYLLMPRLDVTVLTGAAQPSPTWQWFTEALLTAYLSVALTMAALLLGYRYLSRQSWALGLVADSSYWVYLIHLPIVLFIQTLLIPAPWFTWIKLSICIAATMSLCMASYLVFVRYTPLGWMLHGKRSFP